ncbi:type VII secretion protein EccE [Rhodococcus sp. X156]|uniref:type VII secretion protein EccE n=1 Tax=Rhodococcus sp. X156 TaxID=2499145 RepID=UPI000FDB9F5E|nr:type VII secretion protein EccE [Rhodococcus sp. X156]
MSATRGDAAEGAPARHRSRRADAGLRRAPVGTTVAGLPLTNLVVAEVGAAATLLVLALSTRLWPLAALLGVVALALAATRRHGRWLTQWVVILVRFVLRGRSRAVEPAATDPSVTGSRTDAGALAGAADPRVALLRLLVDDLVVASGTDHEQQPIGLAWHDGTWTATVAIDPVPAMVSAVGAHTDIPLRGLAATLDDRGVVLDSIGVIWHCYPASSRLPATSAAVAAYNEVLGPLPAVAQRATWVTVRLDPRRCPSAVQIRGGGVAGAHRALVGAVARVRGALEQAGLTSRVLTRDELLRAAVSAAELAPAAGSSQELQLREHWRGVRTGDVEHASFTIDGWPADGASLEALTSVRALSTTVALALRPGPDEDSVGVRGVVRVSARSSGELAGSLERLRTLSATTGVALSPLDGQQAAAVAATLPVGAGA